MQPEEAVRRQMTLGPEEKTIQGRRCRSFFSHWNYKKHAKFCTAVYLSLYAFDMTVSYFVCKKLLDKLDEEYAD